MQTDADSLWVFEVVTVKGGGAHMFSQSLEGLLILSLPTFFQVSSGCSVNSELCVAKTTWLRTLLYSCSYVIGPPYS